MNDVLSFFSRFVLFSSFQGHVGGEQLPLPAACAMQFTTRTFTLVVMVAGLVQAGLGKLLDASASAYMVGSCFLPCLFTSLHTSYNHSAVPPWCPLVDWRCIIRSWPRPRRSSLLRVCWRELSTSS